MAKISASHCDTWFIVSRIRSRQRPPSGGLLQLVGIMRLVRRLQTIEVIDGLGRLGRGGEDRLLVGLQDGQPRSASG